ncbi:MAG: hypothetical protein KTR18_16965, partial [Acidiferrobacterales bacterium]|nr:hypothetical protein [Acidiferrobacterales bacterium]
CRRSCVLFDFSFVKRVAITGSRAIEVLQEFQPRHLHGMRSGAICYSLRGNSNLPGFAVESDLTVWKLAPDHFEVYSGKKEDVYDLENIAQGRVTVRDHSPTTKIFAVQGPDSLDKLLWLGAEPSLRYLPYFCHQTSRLNGIEVRIGRLGFTGEAGFEIVVKNAEHSRSLWDMLANTVPSAGMIAADILRIEAGFILFLNDCRLGASAKELGVGRFVEWDEARPRFKLVCFQSTGEMEGLPFAADHNILAPNVGEIAVTSANRSQFTDSILGLGLINLCDQEKPKLYDPTERFQNIQLASRPFYDPEKKRPRASWR